ncbi:hypothetical protein LSCM4_03287 [Leishmania orientalis]|uniref:Transmembrane protein n=1 Tax=Leishmania orientalis TaxID=2249476 RepID=A0A836GTT8_9TRYP|nr:hypothetical protein LSCM4_03287 [Leishmania orientalis]
MTQFMVLFPCSFGVVFIVIGIGICCRLRRKMDRYSEGDGRAEGNERAAVVEFGNMLPRSRGNPRLQHELRHLYHGDSEYRQHRGNHYAHEQPVMAAVADVQPCVGLVVTESQGEASSTEQNSIEYGEAVYVSLPDVDLTSKASHCP